MALSGCVVNDECCKAYSAMQLHKGGRVRYTQMKLDDDLKEVIIEKKVEPTGQGREDEWKAFKAQLPPLQGRYIIYDWQRDGAGDGTKTGEVLVLISWCPDAAKTKEKMVYASTREGLKGKFQGLAAIIQATDLDELDEIYDKVK